MYRILDFCVLYLRDGASAGFSLSLKCERRQSIALPRTHSRTRSKKKTAGLKPAIFSNRICFSYEIRPFPPSILFVCPYMRGGASAGFSLSLKCERRQSMALPRTPSRTRSKKKTAGLKPAVFSNHICFFTRYGRFRLRFFLFVRVCAAEPRPDFRCRSNANDGKARLCRVLTRGLAPNKKRTGKTCSFLFGAGNEIRTRDICLGKATLYH